MALESQNAAFQAFMKQAEATGKKDDMFYGTRRPSEETDDEGDEQNEGLYRELCPDGAVATLHGLTLKVPLTCDTRNPMWKRKSAWKPFRFNMV